VSVYTKAGGLLARGARDMPANRTLVVRARLTRLGRHVLRGTTRTTSTLRVSVRDAPTISARVQFVR
jgi:hypothetical protein